MCNHNSTELTALKIRLTNIVGMETQPFPLDRPISLCKFPPTEDTSLGIRMKLPAYAGNHLKTHYNGSG